MGSKILILLLSLLFFNCASNNQLYSAKLGKGENTLRYYGLSYGTTLKGDSNSIPEYQGILPIQANFSVPATEYSNFKVTYLFPIYLGVGVRVNWNQNDSEKGFFFTQDLDFGLINIFNASENSEENDFTVESENSGLFELKSPLYFSYYPIESLGITLTPGYILRYSPKSTSGRYPKSHFSNLLGGSFNIQVGKTRGVGVELGNYHNYYTRFNEYQFSLFFFSTIQVKDNTIKLF